MKAEKFFFPLMVFAAVVTVYLLFRKQPGQVQQMSTAASGVPNLASESPTSYNVGVPQLAANPLVYLSDPANPDPTAGDRSKPPAYLAFNFGPSHDLTKVPSADLSQLQKSASGKGGCGGCGGGCNSCDQNQNVFPDGNGRTPLATSRRKLVDTAPKSFLEIAQANLDEGVTAASQPAPSSPHALEAVYTGPIGQYGMSMHPAKFAVGLGNMHFA